MNAPYYQDDAVTVLAGDCRALLPSLPDASVDAVVTDPPYELGFMGKAWDRSGVAYNPTTWGECLRVLKPGGHLLAFGGSRTAHRLTSAIEDAGFEIRDSIAFLYGQGFPKSLDVSKAIDKARDDKGDVLRLTTRLAELAESAGITRGDVDAHMRTSDMGGWWLSRLPHRCACPSVDNWTRLRDYIPGAAELDAEVWRLNGRKGSPGEAWSTADVLRTDARWNEPSGVVNVGQGGRAWVERAVKAANSDAARQWQGWGTALKPAFEPITVARKPLAGTVAANVLQHGTGALNIDACRIGIALNDLAEMTGRSGASTPNTVWGAGIGHESTWTPEASGRWPANVVLDESQAAALDEQTGVLTSGAWNGSRNRAKFGDQYGEFAGAPEPPRVGDSGGASRFFYTAKASTAERPRTDDGTAHPTVKPLDLMRWLVRLVTPPGGLVLDPFLGSGTTAEACVIEGLRCIGIEQDETYLPLIVQRLSKPIQRDMFGASA